MKLLYLGEDKAEHALNKVINYVCLISHAMKNANYIYQGLSSQVDTIGKMPFSSARSGLTPVATASERSGSD